MPEENVLRLTFNSRFDQFVEMNSSFDRGVLQVCYHGDNRNGSSIDRDSIERNIGSIFNCPIVTRYIREEDDLGGHDMEFVEKNGKYKLINQTHPVGLIPESAKYWFENVEDASGTHEYLFVEALLWKRQEAYDYIKEHGVCKQSMEIKILDGERDGDIYRINDFEFNAFCLLGEDVEPCFESASLKLFEMDNTRSELERMLDEFRLAFNLVQPSEKTLNNTPLTKGGEEKLDEKMKLLAEFGLTLDDLSFDVNEFELDELRAKFEAESVPQEITEEPETPVEAPVEEPEVQLEEFSLTAEQTCEVIREALRSIRIQTEWGECSKYHYVDYDTEQMRVYAYDCEDWKLYGFSYSTEGDNIVIDFDSKKRTKIVYADFDEGESEPTRDFAFIEDLIGNTVELASNAAVENERAAYTQQLSEREAQMANMQTELDELREYRHSVDVAQREAAEEAIFEQFEDLAGVEQFETLRDNCAEMELDEIEEKCFALRGRFGKIAPVKIGAKYQVDQTEDELDIDAPYGGVVEKYRKKRSQRAN